MAIMINEHVFVLIQAIVRYAIQLVPTWADIVARQQEFKLKKTWLDRTASNENEFVGKEIGSKEEGLNSELDTFWMEHKNPEHEVEAAIATIQSSFKSY
jgi:hypothetical protein